MQGEVWLKSPRGINQQLLNNELICQSSETDDMKSNENAIEAESDRGCK